MKRPRETLDAYRAGEFASSAHYDDASKSFTYIEGGVTKRCGGLLSFLAKEYWPHFVEGKSVRKKWNKGRPSNAEQGIRVDSDLETLARTGALPANAHAMSTALVAHWRERGHTLVAAQLPVLIDAYRMTRADALTECKGKLYAWEVKTGMAASLHSKQGVMRAMRTSVPCTKANQWLLQSEYTRGALVRNAGLAIEAGRVIQIYEDRARNIQVKELRVPKWVKEMKL